MLRVLLISTLHGLISVSAAPRPNIAPYPGYTYPDPEPCVGNCSWIHDPSIIYKNKTYYRFSTSGNIAMATAPKLEGPWEYKGALLENGTSIIVKECEKQDIWAPTVNKIGDEWYTFYSVSCMGSQDSDIGYATSPSSSSSSLLPGSWTDHGSLGIPKSASYNLIDPFVHMDRADSLEAIFMFGSFWNGIHQFPFRTPPSEFTYMQPEAVITNRTLDIEVAYGAVVEGGTIWQQDGWYYLFFSAGQCCRTPPDLVALGDVYRVAVCRAKEATGPYVDADGKSCTSENGGTTVLASHGDVYAPGGQGVIFDEESERVIMYYHYVKPSVGYAADQFFFGFNYLEFEGGWPVVVFNTGML